MKFKMVHENYNVLELEKSLEFYHKLHEETGCICFENKDMGRYFIKDPDGYRIEIIPAKK